MSLHKMCRCSDPADKSCGWAGFCRLDRGIQNSMCPPESTCLCSPYPHKVQEIRTAVSPLLLGSCALNVSLNYPPWCRGALETKARGTHATQVPGGDYQIICMDSRGRKLELPFSSHLF